MKSEVAATLMHLGSGMGNGYANLHNAKKAGSGIVNIVGNHATYHIRFESPLKGDIEGLSSSISHWTRTSLDSKSVASDSADAIKAARTNGGQLATLILPANSAWENAIRSVETDPPPPLHRPSKDEITAAAKILKTPGAAMMLGRRALHGDSQALAGKIAQKTGCELVTAHLIPRIQRGAGASIINRAPNMIDLAIDQLKDVTNLVLCGSHRPAAFFAYPNKPSVPTRPDCNIFDLCPPEMDHAWTLQALADELDASNIQLSRTYPKNLPDLPSGMLNVEKASVALAALLPENCIVVDESITCSLSFLGASMNSNSHDWLHGCSGGAIGSCLPVAVGTSIACPDRKVVALTGDGSAMYTVQSLWTMARENLNITVIVLANRGYQVLRREFKNVGAGEMGRNAVTMLDIENPVLDWVSLSKGLGVDAVKVSDAEELVKALKHGLSCESPYLIEIEL